MILTLPICTTIDNILPADSYTFFFKMLIDFFLTARKKC